MDLGLYNLKYPARKLIAGVLPQLADTDPNHVSYTMLPVGLLIAACYWVGARVQPWLYLLAILLIFVRMFLGTLDVLALFLWWVILGGMITIALRLQRNFQAAAQVP